MGRSTGKMGARTGKKRSCPPNAEVSAGHDPNSQNSVSCPKHCPSIAIRPAHGMVSGEYKRIKGLEWENLRYHMTDLEIFPVGKSTTRIFIDNGNRIMNNSIKYMDFL